VGTRTGDPKDVGHLLLAGLYQHSLLDRSQGRLEDAARLVELAAARFPADLEIQLLLAHSQLEDRKDPAAATATLGRVQIPKEERRLRLRHGILLVDALLATGQRDAATAALRSVKSEFPESGEVKERLRRLEEAGPPPAPPAATPSPAPASPSPSPSVPGA
jgi:hypothetical protein